MTNILNKFFTQFFIILDNSFIFSTIDRFLNFLGRLFSSSAVVRFFGKPVDDATLEKTLIYKFFALFSKIMKNFGDVVLNPLIDSSDVVCFVKKHTKFAVVYTKDLSISYLLLLATIAVAPFLPTMTIAAIIGVCFVCYLFKLATDKNCKLYLDATGIFVVLYIVVTFLAAINSYARSSSLKIALLTSFFMLTFFLFVSLVDNLSKLKLALFAFSTSALVTCYFGFMQKISGKVDMTWVDKTLFEDTKLRVYSTFANPNVYGEYLLLAIPLAIAAIILTKRWYLKLYYALVAICCTANLGLTLSRGCYIAIAFAAVVFVLFTKKKLFTLFSLGMFAVPFLLPASIINRILSITNFKDSSTTYRIHIWQASIRMIENFWQSGVGQGPDAYNIVYPFYSFSGITAPHSHNLFMQVLVEVGLFGFIAFMGIIIAFYKTLISYCVATKDITQKAFCAALIAAVTGFLFQGIFDYVFYNYKVFLIFFIVLAIGCAYVNICKKGGAIND